MKFIIYTVMKVLVTGLLVLFSCSQENNDGAVDNLQLKNITSQQIPVEVMIVKRKGVEKNLNLSGILKPKHAVDIVAEVSGKIKKINKNLGDRVSMKDILATIDDGIPLSNYKQAKSQVLSAQNNLDIARLNLLSDEDLFMSGDISKLEYENSQLAVKTAEAGHLSALASFSLMKKAYNDTRITSPIIGYISRKYIDLGMMVNQNSPLYRVVDLSSLKLEIGIPQKMIAYVEPGTKVNIKIPALNQEEFQGSVHYISPQADENTGSFNVEIYVENTSDRRIKAGLTVRVEVILDSHTDQLVIPDYALISRNDSSFVHKVSNHWSQLNPVQIGDSFQNFIIIEDGLMEGDTIVVVGVKNLTDKSKIWIESIQ